MAYDTIYDVIVCGAGTSGTAAAIGAARTGAKTLLVERTGTMGGQMSLSGPPGFAYARLFNPQGKRDIGGIVEETCSEPATPCPICAIPSGKRPVIPSPTWTPSGGPCSCSR